MEDWLQALRELLLPDLTPLPDRDGAGDAPVLPSAQQVQVWALCARLAQNGVFPCLPLALWQGLRAWQAGSAGRLRLAVDDWLLGPGDPEATAPPLPPGLAGSQVLWLHRTCQPQRAWQARLEQAGWTLGVLDFDAAEALGQVLAWGQVQAPGLQAPVLPGLPGRLALTQSLRGQWPAPATQPPWHEMPYYRQPGQSQPVPAFRLLAEAWSWTQHGHRYVYLPGLEGTLALLLSWAEGDQPARPTLPPLPPTGTSAQLIRLEIPACRLRGHTLLDPWLAQETALADLWRPGAPLGPAGLEGAWLGHWAQVVSVDLTPWLETWAVRNALRLRGRPVNETLRLDHPVQLTLVDHRQGLPLLQARWQAS